MFLWSKLVQILTNSVYCLTPQPYQYLTGQVTAQRKNVLEHFQITKNFQHLSGNFQHVSKFFALNKDNIILLSNDTKFL